MHLPYLDINTPFPHPSKALSEPEGLLAAGADLSVSRLLDAYSQGIFPWFDEGDPLLWWSPNPRAILVPNEVYISRSMKKTIKQQHFNITINHAFEEVIEHCAAPRKQQADTWIGCDMMYAYIELHELGHAHSIEVWDKQYLVGGLYGVNIGGLFCGESMFHQSANASKIALIALCQHFTRFGGQLIDCQLPNEHLLSMGVTTISRPEFLTHLLDLRKIQLLNMQENETELSCWNQQSIMINI